MVIREHEPLWRHTTLKTGGPARYFAEAASEADLREAVRFAQEHRLPVFALGEGSNVLARDAGYEGLVLRIANRGLAVERASDGATELVAHAGEAWDAAVAFAVEHNLFGLENLSLIPGTVGAAVVGNIGAYGAEIRQTLQWAEVMDLRTGTTRRFGLEECEFGYRHSFFKTLAGRPFVITRAGFGLRSDGALDLRYQDVRNYFLARGATAPTLRDLRLAVIEIRRRKMPDMALVGTAGSFFKNPVIRLEEYHALVKRYPGLPGHTEPDGRIKVPLGWIMDKICGLKGVRQGRVGTHSEQALVIVNEGGTAAEIEAFANTAARRVMELTGIQVEWEVERL